MNYQYHQQQQLDDPYLRKQNINQSYSPNSQQIQQKSQYQSQMQYGEQQQQQQQYPGNNYQPQQQSYLGQSQMQYDFDDKDVALVHPRIIFLRKLYFMLALQLTIVGLLAFVSYNLTSFNKFLQSQYYIFYIAIALVFLCALIVLIFRRQVGTIPLNIVFYITFTAALAITFTYIITINAKNQISLMIIITTLIIVVGQFLYTLTTKSELTYQGASLFVIGSILLTFQIFLIFTEERFDYLILVCVGEVVFSFYLIYDTQTNVSGVKYDYEKDDYISGAVVVYSDVLILVLKMCELIRQLIIRERS